MSCERTWNRIVESWGSGRPASYRSQDRLRRNRSMRRRRARRKDPSREVPWRSHAASTDTWPRPTSRWSRSLYSRSAIIIATVIETTVAYRAARPRSRSKSAVTRANDGDDLFIDASNRQAVTSRNGKQALKSRNYERGIPLARSDGIYFRWTYLSPRAPRAECVSAAGKEALAVAEEHLDVITTILHALALILTGVDLVLRCGPGGVLQVRQRRQRQAV